MKIFKRIIFITFFVICMSVNLVFARTGKVKIEATRIRQEANTTSNILNVIYENDEVEILEESGEWYKIKFKNDTGYVKKDFITENKEEKKTENTTTTANTTNTTNTASAQKKEENPKNQSVSAQPPSDTEIYGKLLPNFSSTNIVKFDSSKQLNKLTELNNWIQVTDGQTTGWVLKNKLSAFETGKNEAQAKTENTVSQNTVANTTTNSVANKVSNTVKNTTNTATNTTSNKTNTAASNTVASNEENKKAVIIVETAKLREKASTESNVLDFLDYGNEVTILSKEGEWYKVNVRNKTGYLKNTLLKISEENVSSRSLTEERQEEVETKIETTNKNEVADYAKQYLNYSYVVGGKTPESGFDCSGFTKYVFSHFGYSLGSTAASQTNVGTEVSRESLAPGDLVLFLNENKTAVGHTGIYIGEGEFIHSANPQKGVVIDNLNTNSYYNERFVSARRIVN